VQRPHCVYIIVYLLFIYLTTTDKSSGQDVTAILKDKTPHTSIEYNLNDLYTYPGFTLIISK